MGTGNFDTELNEETVHVNYTITPEKKCRASFVYNAKHIVFDINLHNYFAEFVLLFHKVKAHDDLEQFGTSRLINGVAVYSTNAQQGENIALKTIKDVFKYLDQLLEDCQSQDPRYQDRPCHLLSDLEDYCMWYEYTCSIQQLKSYQDYIQLITCECIMYSAFCNENYQNVSWKVVPFLL